MFQENLRGRLRLLDGREPVHRRQRSPDASIFRVVGVESQHRACGPFGRDLRPEWSAGRWTIAAPVPQTNWKQILERRILKRLRRVGRSGDDHETAASLDEVLDELHLS